MNKVVVTMHIRGMSQEDVEAYIDTLAKLMQRIYEAELVVAVKEEPDEESEPKNV